MRAAISAFLEGLYVLIRGRSTVTTSVEPRVYRYMHVYRGLPVNIACQRIRHRIVYERWFMITRTYRTYKVAVVGMDGSPSLEWPTAHFPEFAPWFMVRSHYPVFQAINAYIDCVFEGAKEQKK